MFGFFRRNHVKKEPPRLEAVFVSEVGLVRTENQDSVLVAPNRGVFCVADGMGGGSEGDRASTMVCSEIKSMLSIAEETLEARLDAISRAVTSANAAIYAYAKKRNYEKMASTLALVAFDPEDRTRAVVLHVGDSRVYRIRSGMAQSLTRDHRVRDGVTLTRAVGPHPTVRYDLSRIDVCPGDRFLVCTDGVHNFISDGRLAVFAGTGTVERAAERIAAEVVKQGAPDNYSFVLVQA